MKGGDSMEKLAPLQGVAGVLSIVGGAYLLAGPWLALVTLGLFLLLGAFFTTASPAEADA